MMNPGTVRRPVLCCGAAEGARGGDKGTVRVAAVPLTSMVALATGEPENTNTHRYSPDSSARAFRILQGQHTALN